jgi:hypothetical protein
VTISINPSDALPKAQRPRHHRWSKAGTAFGLAWLCFGLTGCFRVSSDAEALRNGVMKSAGARWDREVEIGVDPFTLSLVRAGLAFVDLDPEARTALNTVRSAEVGVYRLQHGPQQSDRPALLTAADKAMANRGWNRVVAVVNERELVAIYVPKSVRSLRNVKACFVMLNGREMVVASARTNLEPLLEMACSQSEWHQKGRSLIHL